MPLEAVMLILDNSAHAINGDYTPSRFGAQRDAANVLFSVKTNSNPENVVGLMTMAGRGPEVLVTPTQDEGKIVSALHDVKLAGDSDISAGIQVAQLALKHRQNKNQRQRVIVFVGSPLAEKNANLTEANLVKLGKKMKKNNVAIDVVSFGSENDRSDNDTRLRALVDAVNSGDNSHFVTIPPGIGLLSDQIRSSGMLAEDGAGPSGGGGDGVPGGSGGGNADSEFGVDPNLDPELAMALRMSLEEERARQAGANASTSAAAEPSLPPIAESEGANSATSTVPTAVPASAAPTTASQPSEADAHASSAATGAAAASNVPPAAGGLDEAALQAQLDAEEDAELQAALAMSRGEDVDMSGADDEEEDLDEDEAIARAIALSMQTDEAMDEGDEKK